jgi:GDP-D-mannose 3', 5'-epimerase
MAKSVLICGAGGFIGGFLTELLKNENCWVRGVDLVENEFRPSSADEFILGDLRNQEICNRATQGIDEVYQLAADMGGAGYIFTGERDADIVHNSAIINLNIAKACVINSVNKVFYSSSACIYPIFNQLVPDNPDCSEDSAYPAMPDSEYGWEKLFSERLYLSFSRNYDLQVRIARFHNIFGPFGAWNNGKEKAPAALCRKVAEAKNGTSIQIWGDGRQTRSFLYIDECLEGISRLMESNFHGPVNIGSDEMISINELAEMIIEISKKKLTITNIDGPVGVRGRNSDNRLIHQKLQWRPTLPLRAGIEKTYRWIEAEVLKQKTFAEETRN